MAYRLPKECTSLFPPLLRDLQARGKDIGVQDYGLSETTLDEVFHVITCKAHLQTEVGHGDTLRTLPASNQAAVTRSSPLQYPSPAPSLDVWGSPQESTPQRNGPAAPRRLQGAALFLSRFSALLAKRALLASRDRLAVLTQLLVPLLLVLLALWVQGLAIHPLSQHSLDLGRQTVLRGMAGAAGANEDIRSRPTDLAAFLSGYSAGSTSDSGCSFIVGDRVPLSDTLEGHLLDNWHSGTPIYDVVFIQGLPAPIPNTSTRQPFLHPMTETSPPGALIGASLLMYVNQSAVHALPAALNEAMTALLMFHLRDISPGASSLPLSWAGEDYKAISAAGFPSDDIDATIRVASWPLPPLLTEPVVRIQQTAASLMLVLCFTLAASVLTASFAVQLVRERSSGFGLLQVFGIFHPAGILLTGYHHGQESFLIGAFSVDSPLSLSVGFVRTVHTTTLFIPICRP